MLYEVITHHANIKGHTFLGQDNTHLVTEHVITGEQGHDGAFVGSESHCSLHSEQTIQDDRMSSIQLSGVYYGSVTQAGGGVYQKIITLRIDRITSYNVCYTKLLRSGQIHHACDFHLPVTKPASRIMAMNGSFQRFSSIHGP